MKPRGSGEIEVGFIDRGHLHHRRKSGEDRGDAIAPFGIEIVAAFEENRVRAELSGRAQGHGRMNAVAARFITRRRYDSTAIRLSADNDGLSAQLRPIEQLYRNKERVHIHVQNRGCVQPEWRGFALGTEVSEPGHTLVDYCLTRIVGAKPGKLAEAD